jgi:N-acyl-L-homoserine lactone synthetase
VGDEPGFRLLDGLTFKVAEGPEIARALELRRQIYENELGHGGSDRFEREAYHLIASDPAGDIVATLRIVGPDQRPFDLEQLVELDEILPADRVPGELSRFCIRRDRRQVRRHHLLHVAMLKLACAFARKRGLTDFLMLALPHLRNLYRLAFFQRVGGPLEHPTWGPVELMRFDLVGLNARYAQSSKPMARLLFRTDLPAIQL